MNAVTPSAPPAPPAGTPPAPPVTTPSLTGTPPVVPPAGDPPAPPAPPEPPKPGDPPKEPPKEPDAPAAFALDKVKLPEGMKADDPLTAVLRRLMADDKISPAERGQKLLDLYADATKKAGDASTEAWNTVNKEWAAKTLADTDIGGAKWPAAKATIAKAIDSLGPDLAAGLREALDITGAGNHPAVTKALHAWASKLTEGTHIGGNPPSKPQTVKEAFYPNSPDMK
jgi:hypothetical protein